MATQSPMTMKQFHQIFRTEEDCLDHLVNARWSEGFVCPKCGSTHYSFIKTRYLFQCSTCRLQTSPTSGTVMHRTRVPLLTWFWAILLIGQDKRGVSATHLAKELEISYRTAWLLLHKIREAMAARDQVYQLSGLVELDEAFFGAPTEGGKRGRGTEKTIVLAGVSLTPQGYPLFIKLRVIPNVTGETLLATAENTIASGSTINSDAYRSYQALAENYQHHPTVYNPKENPDHLHWLHTIISNAKAFIAGTFHGLDSKHLQRYLDEFSYRTNRRRLGTQLFNHLLTACCRNANYSNLSNSDYFSLK